MKTASAADSNGNIIELVKQGKVSSSQTSNYVQINIYILKTAYTQCTYKYNASMYTVHVTSGKEKERKRERERERKKEREREEREK